MPPDLPTPEQKVTAKKLPLPVILAILVILGATLVYYQAQQNLPKKPAASPPPSKATNVLPPLPAHFLGCPLPESLCQSADFYSTRVKNSSFSAILKQGTPILATFEGDMEGIPISRSLPDGKNENLTLLTITDRKQKLVAQYYFKGQFDKKRPVKEGEIIATSSGVPLNFLEGKSLVFIVQGMTEKGDSGLEPLSAANFK